MAKMLNNTGVKGITDSPILEQDHLQQDKSQKNDKSNIKTPIKAVEPEKHINILVSSQRDDENKPSYKLADRDSKILSPKTIQLANEFQLLQASKLVSTAPTMDEAIAVSSYRKLKTKCAVNKERLDLKSTELKLEILIDLTCNFGHQKKEASIPKVVQNLHSNLENCYEDITDLATTLGSNLAEFRISLPNNMNTMSEKLVTDTVTQLQSASPILNDSINSFCNDLVQIWNNKDTPEVFQHLKSFRKRHGIKPSTNIDHKDIRTALKDIEFQLMSDIKTTLNQLDAGITTTTPHSISIKGGYGTVEFINGSECALLSKKQINTTNNNHINEPVLYKQYALKSQVWPTDPEEQAQCLNEIKNASLITGPAKLYEHRIQDDDTLYLLMDCGGFSLDGLLNQVATSNNNNEHAPLPPELVKFLLQSTGEQLQELHAKSIIHRDIKPANILLDSATNKTTLIDFGLSITEGEQDNVLVGTSGYLAPELKNNYNLYSSKSDVFAFGVVCAELLTGQRSPLQSRNVFSYFVKDISQAIENTKQLVEDCCGSNSEALAILKKMLTADPEQRPSINEVLAHPFFSKATKKTYTYMELDQQLRSKIEALEAIKKHSNQTLIQDISISQSELMNNNLLELAQDIKQLKSALKWHDLESNKKTLQKKLENSMDKENETIYNMIASLSMDQIDLAKHAGGWLTTRPTSNTSYTDNIIKQTNGND